MSNNNLCKSVVKTSNLFTLSMKKIDFIIYSSFRPPAASYQTKHVTGYRS